MNWGYFIGTLFTGFFAGMFVMSHSFISLILFAIAALGLLAWHEHHEFLIEEEEKNDF